MEKDYDKYELEQELKVRDYESLIRKERRLKDLSTEEIEKLLENFKSN